MIPGRSNKGPDFQPRTYRQWVRNIDLTTYTVIVEETDCCISTVTNLAGKARMSILKYRAILKKYIASHPSFPTALKPLPIENDAPQIIKAMTFAGTKAGVGPMAAVAGAVAELVGRDLARFSPEVIVENGGDIFLASRQDRIIGIFAGNSALSGKIGLKITAGDSPLGISTSSGTVGHSLSFGRADAVVVLAETAALSDAVATAVGNLVLTTRDIPAGLEFARRIEGVTGSLIIKDDQMGAAGAVKLVRTELEKTP